VIPTSGRTTARGLAERAVLSPRRQSADVPFQGHPRRSRRAFTLNTGRNRDLSAHDDAGPENRPASWGASWPSIMYESSPLDAATLGAEAGALICRSKHLVGAPSCVARFTPRVARPAFRADPTGRAKRSSLPVHQQLSSHLLRSVLRASLRPNLCAVSAEVFKAKWYGFIARQP